MTDTQRDVRSGEPRRESRLAGRGGSLGRLLPATPAFLVLGVLFLGRMAFAVMFSLWRTESFQPVPGSWTLDNYVKFFTAGAAEIGPFTVPVYIWSFGKTLLMGVVTTAACLALALPFTYYLVRYVRPGRGSDSSCWPSIVPFWTSYLLRVYSWQADPWRDRRAQPAATGDRDHRRALAPVRLQLHGRVHRPHLCVLPIRCPGALRIPRTFRFRPIEAAQDLGARPDQAFRHILLPQIRPGIITACIFVFVPIIGEFLTPTLVGGAQGLLIGNLVVNFFKGAQIARARPSPWSSRHS